ncbi:MAG: hypothetical protein Q8O93_05355 [bacterium]|nr:hypothetical protein [bacterium]
MKNLSPSKGFSRGQIVKLQEMIGHGMNKSTMFQSTPTSEIDRFFKTAVPGLRDVWMDLMVERFQDFTGIFSFPVDYDEPEAISKEIEVGKFDWKYIGLEPAEIPLIGTGQVIQEVREVHFGRVMYNRDLPEALKQRGQELGFKGGFKFADPLTALRLACANPDRQRKYPLAILFTDKNGQLWFLFLYELGDERVLRVFQSHPGSAWDEHVRFLAVCELPSAA